MKEHNRSDRDDLIEAGRRLKEAKRREASSNLGVKAARKPWENRYRTNKGARP
jgi:hypothetical protein